MQSLDNEQYQWQSLLDNKLEEDEQEFEAECGYDLVLQD